MDATTTLTQGGRGGRAYVGQQAERGGATSDPGDLPQPGIPKPAAVADRAEIGR